MSDWREQLADIDYDPALARQARGIIQAICERYNVAPRGMLRKCTSIMKMAWRQGDLDLSVPEVDAVARQAYTLPSALDYYAINTVPDSVTGAASLAPRKVREMASLWSSRVIDRIGDRFFKDNETHPQVMRDSVSAVQFLRSILAGILAKHAAGFDPPEDSNADYTITPFVITELGRKNDLDKPLPGYKIPLRTLIEFFNKLREVQVMLENISPEMMEAAIRDKQEQMKQPFYRT